MPLRLEIKRKLSARSDRVKSVDFHPTEPWILACLYNGNVYVWNYENQNMVKSFEVSDLPVRAGKFVARKNWLVTGADDMCVRVFNYNTHEKVTTFEAHSDYIRSIAIHPTQPFILTSADDMLIKLWDWDKGFRNVQIFEGHTHYVMQVLFNPKDANTFASASLDRTVKVWSLGSAVPNFTLEGHEKGVNCLDYFPGGEKPYLVSGADDRTIKVWDYQQKTCVQTLEGHTQNVSAVAFHPELPLIISGSEDGTVRLWHANTYRLEMTLNYGMERAWTMSMLRGSNDVGLGFDEGCVVIKLGREEPAVSMDSSGKIVWARHNEIQTVNLKSGANEDAADGERLSLPVKELGSCEIYPQTLQHNPNGRFVVVCGDGEYIIYTALAWRNKSYGQALDFVWSADSNEYAVRESTSKVKIFKNFKEKQSLKPAFSAEGIFGGACLAIKSSGFLCFYDWETSAMIRRIDVNPKNVYWSPDGEMLVIACDTSFYVLRYNREAVAAQLATAGDDGVEEAFEVVSEINESVMTGCWEGDCFIYTCTANRLDYYVGGQVHTVAHFDKPLYLLGYIPNNNRVYLVDKDTNIVSYGLSLLVLEYQTAILRDEEEAAAAILPRIPQEQRNKIARFLEGQGKVELALEVATDAEYRFELAMQLGRLDLALKIANELDTEAKWRQLADVALADVSKTALAEDCLRRANDFGGLLVLYLAQGNAAGLAQLADKAEAARKYNIAFIALFLLGQVERCLELLAKTDRPAEAALMARTFLPSHITRYVKLWREALARTHKKHADALADPDEHPDHFPDFALGLEAEKIFFEERDDPLSSIAYVDNRFPLRRDMLEEVRAPVEEEEGAEGEEQEHEVQQETPVQPAKPVTPPMPAVAAAVTPTSVPSSPAPAAATPVEPPQPQPQEQPQQEVEEDPLDDLDLNDDAFEAAAAAGDFDEDDLLA